MTGEHKQLKTLSRGKSSYYVELGDEKSYPIRGIGSSSLELENGGNIHLNNILFIQDLQKNLLSISFIEIKCFLCFQLFLCREESESRRQM